MERKNGKRYVPKEWGDLDLSPSVVMCFYLQQALKRFRTTPFLFDQATMKFPDTQIDIGKLLEEAKSFLGYLQAEVEEKKDGHWAYWIIHNDPILRKSLEKHETVQEVLNSYRRSLSYLERFMYGEISEAISNTFLLERFAAIAFDNAVTLSK